MSQPGTSSMPTFHPGRSEAAILRPESVDDQSVELTPKLAACSTGRLDAVGRGWLVYLLGALCLAGLIVLFRSHLLSPAWLTNLLASAKAVYKELPLRWRIPIYSFRERFLGAFANPYYYLGAAAVFSLEWLFPVKKQGFLRVGVAQDLLYYIFGSMVLIYATVPYIRFLDSFYAKHLAVLTVSTVASWPFAIRATFGLVLNDLLHWTHHFLRHKIKPLWYFHMVHHSQQDMSFLTDARVHFVDIFLAIGLVAIPLNMFAVTFANTGWLYFIPVLYFRFYHSNIKTNLGPLKYILVTPQSHRIHHSAEEKHWDKNYGFLFTIWDHVFGTQYKNYDEYPDTGVADVRFPREKSFAGVTKMFDIQLLYPFRRLFQMKRGL